MTPSTKRRTTAALKRLNPRKRYTFDEQDRLVLKK